MLRRYLPAGCARPGHLPESLGGVPVLAGPDGARAAPGGAPVGLVVGGRYQAGEGGWHQVPGQAWWVHAGSGQPGEDLRPDALPGTPLPASGGRQWLAPSVLTRAGDHGLRSLLPRRLTAQGWQHDPADERLVLLCQAVAGRLLCGHHDERTDTERDADLLELATVVIGRQYWLALAEVIALGWLTDADAAALVAGCLAAALPADPEAEG